VRRRNVCERSIELLRAPIIDVNVASAPNDCPRLTNCISANAVYLLDLLAFLAFPSSLRERNRVRPMIEKEIPDLSPSAAIISITEHPAQHFTKSPRSPSETESDGDRS
jgi:hypothetical protein